MTSAEYLFDLSRYDSLKKPSFPSLNNPVWTQNKANFIARYLKSFTFVTKHGVYIDAFSGPQHFMSKDESWAAKLVLENNPRWLRHFYLFEKNKKQVKHLHALQQMHKDIDAKRKIEVTKGDCNLTLPSFLLTNPIGEKEATFCLLDQWATECNWDTVKTIAAYKGRSGGLKIEIFYFLAQKWIDRAIKSWRKDIDVRRIKWWGRDDLSVFLSLSNHERARMMAARFEEELGYSYVYPYPIQKEGKGGSIMFWMIHASDHPRAPELMHQAYNYVGAGNGFNDAVDQLALGCVFKITPTTRL